MARVPPTTGRRIGAALARLLWLLGVGGGALAVAQPANDRARATPRALRGTPAVVAMDLSSGLPVVGAMVNGVPLRLVLDSGAGYCVLSPDAAERTGVRVWQPADLVARDAAGNRKAVDAAHIDRLTLPAADGDRGAGVGVEIGDFDAIVLDSPVVKAAGADGIVGLPLFARAAVRLDFPAGTATIGADPLRDADAPGTIPLRAVNGLMAIDATYLPTTPTTPTTRAAPEAGGDDESHEAAAGGDRAGGAGGDGGGGGEVDAAAAGEPVALTLLLDTGFSGVLHLPSATAGQLAGDAAAANAADGGTSTTALDEQPFQSIRLDGALTFAAHRLTRPAASLFPGDRGAGNGALGTGLLRHYVVTIDLPRRRVRFEGPAEVAEPGRAQSATRPS